MLINQKHVEIEKLCGRWAKYKSTDQRLRERRSRDLQRELADILEHELRPFLGELMLMYHTFLTMVPSGVHSFAHGSEMVSKQVYWVTVARVRETNLIRTPATSRMIGSEEAKMRIGFAGKYLVQTGKVVSLRPGYRSGSHRPWFRLTEEKPTTTATEAYTGVDVAALGHHLFSLRKKEHDWLTQIDIVFGNESVRQWLIDHDSEETFATLSHL